MSCPPRPCYVGNAKPPRPLPRCKALHVAGIQHGTAQAIRAACGAQALNPYRVIVADDCHGDLAFAQEDGRDVWSYLRSMTIFDQTVHRPWPMPRRPWVMVMHWQDLLFLHWPLRPEVLRPLLPPPLQLETFDRWAWIGVVPFRMTGMHPRGLPTRLCSMAFPELNVRTYVTHAGRPGVWFFSLDAASRLAVRGARWWYGLPYYDARMGIQHLDDRVSYVSHRTHRNSPPATFEGIYWPTGAVYQAEPGTLDHWLTERYCLYTVDRGGRVGRLEIHHPPWPLQPAEVEIRQQTMTRPLAIELPRQKPARHFARHQEVVAWALERSA